MGFFSVCGKIISKTIENGMIYLAGYQTGDSSNDSEKIQNALTQKEHEIAIYNQQNLTNTQKSESELLKTLVIILICFAGLILLIIFAAILYNLKSKKQSKVQHIPLSTLRNNAQNVSSL